MTGDGERLMAQVSGQMKGSKGLEKVKGLKIQEEELLGFLSSFFFVSSSLGHATQYVGSQLPDQGSNPCP